MNHKARYKLLSETQSLPIFMQPWWLDAVCGNAWNVALSFDKGGNIRGALAYQTRRYWIFSAILNPHLTPYTGVWLSIDADAKTHTRHGLEHEISKSLIEQIPNFPLVQICTSIDFSDALAFHWQGFRQQVKYSYLLDYPIDINAFFKYVRADIRGAYRFGEQYYTVKCIEDVAVFYEFNQLAFSRKGQKIPYTLALVQRIDAACKAQNARTIYVAYLGDVPLAMLYAVHDSQTTTNLMNAFDPSIKDNKGKSFLLCHAIKVAAERGHRFDFEGSMLPGVEFFVRGFGGVAKPYYVFSKAKNRFWRVVNYVMRDRF